MMDNEKIIRKKVFVYGAVQGVGFRYRAEHAANMLGVTGWVRNEPDGSVLLEVQGTDEQIDKVLAMVNQDSCRHLPTAEYCIPAYGFRHSIFYSLP